MKRLLLLVVLILIPLFFPRLTFAHDMEYGVINTQMLVEQSIISFTTDVPMIFDEGDTPMDEQYLLYTDYVGNSFKIAQRGEPCLPTVNLIEVISETTTRIGGQYFCSEQVSGLSELTMENTAYANFFHDYDHFVKFSVEGSLSEIVFDPEKTSYPPQNQSVEQQGVSEEATVSLWQVVKRFVVMGVEHIVFGYDHVLFLIAMVLVITNLKDILKLVTSFTIAHSVTLIAAAMGWVSVLASFVEPVIALSIAFVALRNLLMLLKKKTVQLKERWIIVFIFGLVHGLGFAGSIENVGMPSDKLLEAIVSFNIGVEIGQLAILAVVMPYLILMKHKKYHNKVLIAVSGIIFLISTFWFFERIVGYFL